MLRRRARRAVRGASTASLGRALLVDSAVPKWHLSVDSPSDRSIATVSTHYGAIYIGTVMEI